MSSSVSLLRVKLVSRVYSTSTDLHFDSEFRFSFVRPTLLSFIGLPASGKSSLAAAMHSYYVDGNERNKARLYLECEERDYPAYVRTCFEHYDKAGSALRIYQYFRDQRVRALQEAYYRKMAHGESGIIDSYFDKLMYQFLKHDAMKALINDKHKDYQEIINIAKEDHFCHLHAINETYSTAAAPTEHHSYATHTNSLHCHSHFASSSASRDLVAGQVPLVDVLCVLDVPSFSAYTANQRSRSRVTFEPNSSIYEAQSHLIQESLQFATQHQIIPIVIKQNSSVQRTLHTILHSLMKNQLIAVDQPSKQHNRQRQLFYHLSGESNATSKSTYHSNLHSPFPITTAYSLIRRGVDLTDSHVSSLAAHMHHYSPAQLVSLAVQLSFKSVPSVAEQNFILSLPQLSLAVYGNVYQVQILQLLSLYFSANDFRQHSFPFDSPTHVPYYSTLLKLKSCEKLCTGEMRALLLAYQREEINDVIMAAALQSIMCTGNLDIHIEMCETMKLSGKIYDYREHKIGNGSTAEPSDINYDVRGRKLIRRYPTGALSEKIALIMPSVITALSSQFPIASNFLVAKTMSWTGGTWDKLSTIPGFTFPEQGEQCMRLLSQPPHVAMSVTKGDFNPLDRRLYALRSATGTVDNLSLIVASIASKQIALPAHYLLMDVRWGTGAFVKTKEEATRMAELLMTLCRPHMNADFVLTDTPEPTGAAIGNVLEIIEAVQVMKLKSPIEHCSTSSEQDLSSVISDYSHPCDVSPVTNSVNAFHRTVNTGTLSWNVNALQQQQKLVIDMLAKMLTAVLPHLGNEVHFKQQIARYFDDDTVLRSFECLLLAHGVSSEVIYRVVNDPEEILLGNQSRMPIVSSVAGRLVSIDQEALGLFVNFTLFTGLNHFVQRKESNGAGVVLHVRLRDEISVGTPLCTLIVHQEYFQQHQQAIMKTLLLCFNIA
jgi:thymidine phosphorylase